MNDYCVILSTYDNKQTGKQIISSLLEQGLAACIQTKKIKSHYRWQGKTVASKEHLLIIKTKSSLYDAVEQDILKNHNYQTPEIIKLDIASGSSEYLTWIDSETKG